MTAVSPMTHMARPLACIQSMSPSCQSAKTAARQTHCERSVSGCFPCVQCVNTCNHTHHAPAGTLLCAGQSPGVLCRARAHPHNTLLLQAAPQHSPYSLSRPKIVSQLYNTVVTIRTHGAQPPHLSTAASKLTCCPHKPHSP
jgi:hypothetical protein